ncbi:MAG: glutamate 5-kinase [Thermaerobacter sp.]|nr:glutamate 5-kinase [Thermaerobacter sp.]
MTARRIVVKIGSSSLTRADGLLSIESMARLAAQIGALRHTDGAEVILVSSGAVAAGLGRLHWRPSEVTLREKQSAAAVGQGLLIDAYRDLFAVQDVEVAQVLLVRSDLEERRRYVHVRNTLSTLLRHGVLPIVNENDTVAVDEIRFGDNDTLAGLVALVADANLLLLLTDTDGFYDADPRTESSAQKIPDVWELTDSMAKMAGRAGSRVGTGGMRTKLEAARIAMDAGIDTVVVGSEEPDVLQRVLAGEPLGTTFHARRDPLPRKKLWMVHGSRPAGRLTLDAGAVDAVLERSASLLLPGITGISGAFRSGDVIELATLSGRVIGKGIVNCSSWDLKDWLARRKPGAAARELRVVHHREMSIEREGIRDAGIEA